MQKIFRELQEMKTKLSQKGRTNKRSLMAISFLVIAFMLVPMVSAVWWNPFTWFDEEQNTVIQKGGKWLQDYSTDDDYFLWVENSSKKKTEICLLHNTATELNDLDTHKNLYGEEKQIIEKLNRKKKNIDGENFYGFCRRIESDEVDFIKFGEHSTVVSYEEEVLEVSDEDDNLIAEIILKTDDLYYKNGKPNVDVGVGKNQIVHYFWINKTQNYSNIIENIYFKNMKTNETIERDFNLKYFIYEEELVDDYGCIENITSQNGTIGCEERGIIGSHYETKLNEYNLTQEILDNNNELLVGVETETKEGDYIDVLFDFAGVDIGIFWATWTASLNVDLDQYYKLDETSGTTAYDSIGAYNGTNNGATINQVGKINKAYDFEEGDDDDITLPTKSASTDEDFSISMWIKAESWGDYRGLVNYGGSDGYVFYTHGSGELGVYTDGHYRTTETMSTGQWYHVAITYDGSDQKLYINGTEEKDDNLVSVSSYNSAGRIANFYYGASTNKFDGLIDEVGIWSRELTPGEITQLYNDFDGITWTNFFGTDPTVLLTSPSNGTEFITTNTVNFEYSCLDDIKVDNCTLFINGASEYVNTSGINGTYSYSAGFEDGYYNWSVVAWNNQSRTATNDTWYFNVSYVTGIKTTLNTPVDTANLTNKTVTFNADATDNYGISNVSLWINGVLNTTDTSQVNGTYEWVRDMTDGSHSWFIEVYDNDSNGINSTTYNFVIDTTPFIDFLTPPTLPNYANSSLNYIPIKVNVSTPYFKNITYTLQNPNGTNITKFYTNETYDINFTNVASAHYHYSVESCTTTNQCNTTNLRHINHDFEAPIINTTSPVSPTDYLRAGDNITINFSIIESNLDSCIVQSVNTNYTLPFCYTGSNNSISVPFQGSSWVGVYANDTLGNMAFQNYTWVTKVTELNQTFDATARSGDVAAYYIYLWVDSSYDISNSNFVFDGTEIEDPSLFSFGENKTLFVSDFIVPGYSSETNVSFYWNMTLNDATDISIINQTQLITTINLDNCSNFTYQLFNFTLLKEREQTSLTGDIEVFFQLINNLNYGEINSYNILLDDVANGLVCSSTDLLGQSVLYNSEVRYWADDYETELYYIQRASIEDGGTNVSLYDLDSNHSTEFKITYQDSNFDFVKDAIIQLQRKYISENLFKTVEAPKTSDEGTAIAHIDLDSVVYRATVVKDGVVLNVFDNIVFSCESELTGECTQKLLGSIDPQNERNYDTQRDFAYTTSSDNDSVSISFTIPSGAPSSINMQLKQIDQFGNNTLCNKTLTSSAGLIECGYNATLGDSYLELKLFKNGEPIEMKGYLVPEANAVDFLQNNYVIAAILLLTLIGLALTSPEWIILNGIVSLVISGALWLVNGLNFAMGLGLIMWLVIAAGIIISKLAKQEDR